MIGAENYDGRCISLLDGLPCGRPLHEKRGMCKECIVASGRKLDPVKPGDWEKDPMNIDILREPCSICGAGAGIGCDQATPRLFHGDRVDAAVRTLNPERFVTR